MTLALPPAVILSEEPLFAFLQTSGEFLRANMSGPQDDENSVGAPKPFLTV